MIASLPASGNDGRSSFVTVSSDLPERNSCVQSGIAPHILARQILRQPECDPREPLLFRDIDMSLICDVEMAGLRELICAVLSVRDRRPWSGNGKRVSVCKLTTFLGKNFDIHPLHIRNLYLSLVFLTPLFNFAIFHTFQDVVLGMDLPKIRMSSKIVENRQNATAQQSFSLTVNSVLLLVMTTIVSAFNCRTLNFKQKGT